MSKNRETTVEERQRLMYDNLPVYCSFWDESFKKIDCSLGAVSFFELKDKQDYLDKGFELSPEYQPDGTLSTDKAFEMLKLAFDTGYARFEWMHQKLDGEPVPSEVIFVRVDLGNEHKAVVGYTRDLREIKAAEAKAKEAERYRQLMIDVAPLYCTVFDEKFNIIDCDSVTLRLFGLNNRQEFIRRFFEFSPKHQPDGKPSKKKIFELFRTALEKGRCVSEWMHQKPYGAPMPYEITFVKVVNDGRVVVAGFGKDLQELKAAEAKAKEAEKRAQLMLDAMPLACTLWDEDLNIIDCNFEMARLFGLSGKQECMERFYDFSPEYQPDVSYSKPLIPEHLSYAFKHGRYVFEWLHQKPNGEPVPSEVTLIRIETDSEHIVVLACIRDLRAEKIAKAEADYANERMRIMFDVMPFGYIFWNENLDIIDCNDETIKLFDVENKKFFIDNFYNLSPKHQPDGKLSKERTLWLINYAFEHGRVVFEWIHQKPNGDLIPVEITLVRAKHHTGLVVIGYIHDLREIKDKSAKLDIAEKLAFSDPLTGIHNRRYFMQFADHVFNTRNSATLYVGIIMLDLDHFKRVNDSYGHEAGDEALKLITCAVQNVLRETDLFARYGGEEFIILIQNLNLDALTKLARRICKKIEDTEFFYNKVKIPMTISAGVAIRKDTTYSLEEVIKHADLALYRAKANGRNRVEVSAE